MKFKALIAASAATILALSTGALAQEFVPRIFGHEVRVAKDESFMDVLSLDGKTALRDAAIYIEEIGIAGSYPFIVGSAGPGGNMCAGTPFVISFESEVPTVDVSPLECVSLEFAPNQDGLLFKSYGNAVSPSQHWQWSPASGFVSVAAPAVAATSGWDAFRSRQITAPADLMAYPDLVEQLRSVIGTDWDKLQASISGPPDGEYVQTNWIGTNCWSHACPFGGTFIGVDLSGRKMFVALATTSPSLVELYPGRESWPEAMLQRLDIWSDQW